MNTFFFIIFMLLGTICLYFGIEMAAAEDANSIILLLMSAICVKEGVNSAKKA